MNKALIVIVSAFLIFLTSSCSNNTGQKTEAALKDSIQGDTFILKDSVFIPLQNIFYPDSSADTNLILRKGNISFYSINNAGGCYYHYDCVMKLRNNTYKSFNLWDDNMIDIAFNYDSVMVQELDINGRGNNELVINMPFEGHHMYGDDNGGGWSYSYNWVEVWDIDEMKELFHCIPYEETWTREDKDYYNFYRYDFRITPDNSIILANLRIKVKDEIVPVKSKKADVKLGTYRFQNDTFVWVSSKQ